MKTIYKVGLVVGGAYLLTRDSGAGSAKASGSGGASGGGMTLMGVGNVSEVVGVVGKAGAVADQTMTTGQSVQAQIDERARQDAERTAAGQAAIDAERRLEQAVNESFVAADNTTAGAIKFLTFG